MDKIRIRDKPPGSAILVRYLVPAGTICNVPYDVNCEVTKPHVTSRLTFDITLDQREIQLLRGAAHLIAELPEEGGEEGVGEGGELGGEQAAQYGSELDQLGPHR
jgi:hypothetical protein